MDGKIIISRNFAIHYFDVFIPKNKKREPLFAIPACIFDFTGRLFPNAWTAEHGDNDLHPFLAARPAQLSDLATENPVSPRYYRSFAHTAWRHGNADGVAASAIIHQTNVGRNGTTARCTTATVALNWRRDGCHRQNRRFYPLVCDHRSVQNRSRFLGGSDIGR